MGAKDKVKRRVAHCKDAGHEVVQRKESDGSWLCLHNDDKAKDLKEVAAFKKKDKYFPGYAKPKYDKKNW